MAHHHGMTRSTPEAGNRLYSSRYAFPPCAGQNGPTTCPHLEGLIAFRIDDQRAHDRIAGAVEWRRSGRSRLLSALLREVRPGLRVAVRVARSSVARGLSAVRHRRRAHRRIGLEVREPGALRRRPDDQVEGGVGEREDVPNGARDLGGRPALLDGLRSPRVGRSPQGARRDAPRPADSGGSGRATPGSGDSVISLTVRWAFSPRRSWTVSGALC